MILGGVALALVVALGVFSVGITVLDGGQASTRRSRGEPPQKRPHFGAQGAAFTPLDLGPSPMTWPSEQPWHMRGLPKLPWPSETWPDGPFSKNRPPVDPEADPPPPREKPAPKATAKKPNPQKRAPKSPEPLVSFEPPPRDLVASVGDPIDTVPSGPSAEDMLQWADSEGLAAAVEKIRARTGWEFRQAAEHLASAMRARRQR